MRKFLFGIMVLLVGVVAVVNCASAALSPIGTTWTSDNTYEVNNATPGLSKSFVGTYAQGPIGTVAATTYTSTSAGCPALAGGVATPTTTVFKVTSGAAGGQCYRLGNAVIPGSIASGNTIPAYNQTLTAVLVTDGGKDFVITPVTTTGFTSVTLDDVRDSVTLKYIDASIGWVIEGNNGATIQ